MQSDNLARGEEIVADIQAVDVGVRAEVIIDADTDMAVSVDKNSTTYSTDHLGGGRQPYGELEASEGQR